MLEDHGRASVPWCEAELTIEPLTLGPGLTGEVFEPEGVSLGCVESIVLAAALLGIFGQARIDGYPVAFDQNGCWNSLATFVQQLD